MCGIQGEIVSEQIITEDQAVAEVFNKYLLFMALIMILLPLIARLQTLSISLRIIQVSL